MNVLEIPDSKVYELVIEILAEHIGLDGTTRFLESVNHARTTSK